MKLKSTIELYAGGPGSGCRGDNCGRPSIVNKIYQVEGVNQDNRTTHTFIARDSANKKIGTLEAILHPEDMLHVDQSYVVPEHRGKGIGTALYQAALMLAKERGYSALESAYSVSDKAAKVWRKMGGEEFRDAPGASTRFRIKV